MAYLDIASARPAVPPADELSFAEPPAVMPARSVEDWFGDLERDLEDAEVLELVGKEWLKPDALRRHVDALVETLSRRGVRIEDSSRG